MSDTKKDMLNNTDPQISVRADQEFEEWSKKLEVSAEQLKKAIEKAGLNTETVKALFKNVIKTDDSDIIETN
jgi:transcription antitermination factor NusA-like protein